MRLIKVTSCGCCDQFIVGDSSLNHGKSKCGLNNKFMYRDFDSNDKSMWCPDSWRRLPVEKCGDCPNCNVVLSRCDELDAPVDKNTIHGDCVLEML